jgi:chemotaxis signal transduction protein
MSRRVVASDDELQFVVFHVGDRELALSIVQVDRILRYEPPEHWPAGPRFLAGRITYDGIPVPVLDLRPRAGQRPAFHEETRTMVLAPGSAPLAVVVDQVNEVLRVDTRTILPPEGELRSPFAEAASGIIPRPGRSILILNAARLLTDEERLALSEALT